MATKSEVKAVEPVPMAEPDGGWPADEFTGEPGHFVRDPFTGVRSRAVPVEPAVPVVQGE